jgi:hypothetical protein
LPGVPRATDSLDGESIAFYEAISLGDKKKKKKKVFLKTVTVVRDYGITRLFRIISPNLFKISSTEYNVAWSENALPNDRAHLTTSRYPRFEISRFFFFFIDTRSRRVSCSRTPVPFAAA